jgi:pimeloyl-ACP methyl ester carboxylesterase
MSGVTGDGGLSPVVRWPLADRGCTLAARILGEGRPVLFLHGFPLDHSMWSGQLPLAERFRLILPDLRGFGRSDAGGGIQSIEQLADDVASLLAAIGEQRPVVVCGLSMGGYVAEHLVVRHRHLAAGLVLVDTRMEADNDSARAGRAALAERVRREGPAAACEMVPRLLAASRAGLPEGRARAAWLEARILDTPAETIQGALAALAARPDMTEALSRCDLPTLAVIGEEDSITPREAMERIVRTMPGRPWKKSSDTFSTQENLQFSRALHAPHVIHDVRQTVFPQPAGARLVVAPACGHMTPLENPEAFNRELTAFVEGLPPA